MVMLGDGKLSFKLSLTLMWKRLSNTSNSIVYRYFGDSWYDINTNTVWQSTGVNKKAIDRMVTKCTRKNSLEFGISRSSRRRCQFLLFFLFQALEMGNKKFNTPNNSWGDLRDATSIQPTECCAAHR